MTEVFVDVGDLHLEFKPIPVKISFGYGWTFLQKVSGSLGKAAKGLDSSNFNEGADMIGICASLLPALGDAIDKLVNSFDDKEVMRIIEAHRPYIKVLDSDNEKLELNFDYHFKNRPELLMILFVRIVEVYYKRFFTEFLTLPEIKERIDKVKETMRNSKIETVQEE